MMKTNVRLKVAAWLAPVVLLAGCSSPSATPGTAPSGQLGETGTINVKLPNGKSVLCVYVNSTSGPSGISCDFAGSASK